MSREGTDHEPPRQGHVGGAHPDVGPPRGHCPSSPPPSSMMVLEPSATASARVDTASSCDGPAMSVTDGSAPTAPRNIALVTRAAEVPDRTNALGARAPPT